MIDIPKPLHLPDAPPRKEYAAPDMFEFLAAIPDFEDRGVEHTAPCPCGGTIHAIRSTYNGHLHARCDKCKSTLME